MLILPSGTGLTLTEDLPGTPAVFQVDVGDPLAGTLGQQASRVLQTSKAVDAAFIWDSTARQYGLDVVEVPEFREAAATITAGVLTASERPTAALQFARYLAAPEKGGASFKKHHYDPVDPAGER